ncbi:MAG: hypothetical protein ACREVA_12890, partial [Burkholderiales bacterium]
MRPLLARIVGAAHPVDVHPSPPGPPRPPPIKRQPAVPAHRTGLWAWRVDAASTGQPLSDIHPQREYDHHRLPVSAQTPGCWLHRGGQLISTATFFLSPPPTTTLSVT